MARKHSPVYIRHISRSGAQAKESLAVDEFMSIVHSFFYPEANEELEFRREYLNENYRPLPDTPVRPSPGARVVRRRVEG